MYFNRKCSGLQAHAGEIRVQGVSYGFNAIVRPAKFPPHISADSPRFMEPSRPAEIVFYMLFDEEGNDRTGICIRNAAEWKIFDYIHSHREYQQVAERIMGVVA
jgi:hypothetical protein